MVGNEIFKRRWLPESRARLTAIVSLVCLRAVWRDACDSVAHCSSKIAGLSNARGVVRHRNTNLLLGANILRNVISRRLPAQGMMEYRPKGANQNPMTL